MREVATTRAARVPSGAQLFGGRLDGATVAIWSRSADLVVLFLEDGTELRLDPAAPVAWLHPAGRMAPA